MHFECPFVRAIKNYSAVTKIPYFRRKDIARSILMAAKKFEMKKRELDVSDKPKQSVKKEGPRTQCNQCGKMVARMKTHLKSHSEKKKKMKMSQHLCELCGRVFKSKSSLSSHRRFQHELLARPKPFKCSTCDFSSWLKSQLRIHERSHTDERPFDCKYCDKKFRHRGGLNYHIRTHTGERPHLCNICGASFTGRYKRSSNGPIYSCEFCQKKFYRLLTYETHRSTHTGVAAAIPKKQCNECGKMIHAKGFQDHVKLHSGIKSHLCELCGRAFVFRSSLNSHIRLNHRGISRTKPPKNFMCSTCGHTVSSKERLGIHERIHTDERPFDCKYCDKKFREKGTLVRHIRTHTGERPYACNICGKSYRSRFAYVSHHRTKHETNEKEGKKDPMEDRRKHPKIGYRCEYCGKEFCQGRILAYEKHLTTHTGVSAAIPCPQPGCDFTYSDMTQLKEHTLAQHPEKAYTCDVCNKIFLTKQTLTDHRSMHDPTRGFQCSFCPVKLTVKSSLIAHEKLHTRETPHECSFCEMRFHSTYLLQIHIRTHQPSQLKRKRYRKPVEK
ncbi:hypothetical protein GHT06_019705 [Daphnia sinensis]|uniref:C2H2-type domain-containing protein n=1 Tax=Daphnia sinensis TaxID=1820382 RepID=A0AAD5LB58_9CRUS|nr:hypothetical protein GHT06_019705 [Daphnia sinensis]